MKRWGRWAPVAVLLLGIVVAILYSESLKTRVAIGAKAPEFELDLLRGGVVRSEQYLGKPVLVNFWAAWCPPCLEEMPAHEEFYRRYGDRIEYLAVNERETVARIERHLNEVAELGLTMDLPIALDRRGTVGDAFRVGGLPETWLIDGEGVARQHWVGPITFEQLEAGYRGIVGRSPDAEDGGPFHGGDGARAVLATDGTLEPLFIGGVGGLARYDGLRGGVDEWRWVDEADAFALLREPPASGDVAVLTAAAAPGLPDAPSNVGEAPDGRRLAWVPGHGLFASRRDEGSWQPVESGLPASMNYAALAPAPFTAGHWVMATAGGLFESRDGGVTWHATGFRERSYGAVFDPVAPRRLYIAVHDGVWLSEDDGRTARRLPAAPQRRFAAVDALPGPAGATTVVALAPNGDVYASDDSGRSWRPLIPGPGVK